MKLYHVLLGIAIVFFALNHAHCQQYLPGPTMTGLQFPDHPQTAVNIQLPTGGGASVTASGEQTSNFPSPARQESLGDAARRLKAEHANDKKSPVVYVNQ